MHSIGEASRRSGVHIETIRYYEREGILPPAERTASGRRLYDPQAIARLHFVRRCRDLGFPMADMRSLLELTESATPCAEAKGIAESNLATVRGKIDELQALERALTKLIAQCDDQGASCAMLNVLMEKPGT